MWRYALRPHRPATVQQTIETELHQYVHTSSHAQNRVELALHHDYNTLLSNDDVRR